MFAVARHGDQPVGVRLADQVIGTGDYHLAVLAQDAPFTVAQNTHPATFIGFADLGIKAGNDGFPRFVDTAPELAGLHPGHAVVERPGHRKLRSHDRPACGIYIAPQPFGLLHGGQSVVETPGIGITAFDDQPSRPVDIPQRPTPSLISSTAARLSFTDPTSAYLAVRCSNVRPHETSVATVRKIAGVS